jgi:indole-3-glycerol phosphate synthase
LSATVPSVLARILAETRAEVDRRKLAAPLGQDGDGERAAEARQEGDGERPAEAGPARAGAPGEQAAVGSARARPFRDALAAPGIGVIGEFKRRSPSAGSLHEAPQLEQIVGAYERGGAVAASILTEGPNFGGSLEDLRDARRACGLPLLRKDFVIDPYQLHEARAAGADAVLLIVAALPDGELRALHEQAARLGLDALVEVHDEHELDRACELGAQIIGVNNRDLRDFSVDVGRTARLMERMPPGAVVVSESGIAQALQLAELERQGVDAVLVGETLMRAADPAAAIRDLTGP